MDSCAKGRAPKVSTEGEVVIRKQEKEREKAGSRKRMVKLYCISARLIAMTLELQLIADDDKVKRKQRMRVSRQQLRYITSKRRHVARPAKESTESIPRLNGLGGAASPGPVRCVSVETRACLSNH